MFAKSRISSRRNQMIAGVALLAGAFSFTLLRAAPATQPTGEEVIAKSIEATGGKAAYEKITSRVITAKLDLPAQGMHGTVEIYSKNPNLLYVMVEIPGAEKKEDGFDGKTGWEKSAVQGTRLLEGDELEILKQQSDAMGDLDWKKHYKSVSNDGTVDVDGKSCYKLTLINTMGKPEVRFYDTQTGLLVQTDSEAEMMGTTIHSVATTGDWRDVNGIKVPFKNTVTVNVNGMQINQNIEMEKVEFNTDIPASRFDIPDDVKALLKDNASTQPSK